MTTSVDPVNDVLLMSGWEDIAPPAVGPNPGTTFTTPGGNPALKLKRNNNIIVVTRTRI
jgi:hypothetical protein